MSSDPKEFLQKLEEVIKDFDKLLENWTNTLMELDCKIYKYLQAKKCKS